MFVCNVLNDTAIQISFSVKRAHKMGKLLKLISETTTYVNWIDVYTVLALTWNKKNPDLLYVLLMWSMQGGIESILALEDVISKLIYVFSYFCTMLNLLISFHQ